MVLRVLCHADAPMTGRAVERECGLSNRATMNALDSLVAARAVNMEQSGRAHLYEVNGYNYLVSKAIRPAFDAEELFWNDLTKTIRKILKPRPIAALATGPLARDETEYGGRLMLTILYDDGRKRIKSLASIQQLAQAVRDRYSLVLEHNLLDVNTMDRKEYEPLWRRVEREGILLLGNLP